MTPYIFTEAYNCGKILKRCLETFHRHHDNKVHIFGKRPDFDELGEIRTHPNNVLIDVSTDTMLECLYRNGHSGTAYIFAKAFHHETNEHNDIVHFDSDVIFRGECLSDITTKFDEGFDIVGTRRCYRHNRNHRDDVRSQPDTVNTFFFGMKKDKIDKVDFNTLRSMCEGHNAITGHKIIDFFDPVVYSGLVNGARVHFLDYNDYGCFDENGSKCNAYPELNELMDFGHKIVHFAGVGSGYNNYKNGTTTSSYSSWSVERFYLYSSSVLGENLGSHDAPLADKIRTILS